MLSCNRQQQPSNENRFILHRDRESCNNFRGGINNRTRTLTTPSPMMTHLNMANRFHHFLYSMPGNNLTSIMEIVILQTTLIKQLELKNMHITPNLSKQDNHMAKLQGKQLHTKMCDCRNNINMFPMGTLSFQASQQIRSHYNLSVSKNTIKCCLRK